ncbi:MAG: glycosyl hydrolase family 28 protein [Armatimonadota bacterium]
MNYLSIIFNTILAIYTAIFLLPLNCLAQNNVKENAVFYSVPDAVYNSPWLVKVNNKLAPIEKAGSFNGAYYVRYQSDNSAKIEVELKEASNPTLILKPFKYNPTINKNLIIFDMESCGTAVVTVKDAEKYIWPLIIVKDEPEKFQLSDVAKVYNIKNYLTGDGVQTSNIQKALDECYANGGGIVYFPDGIYYTGTIRIKSNTTLYLANGALIKASHNPDDFPVDEGRKEHGTHGPVCSFSRVVMFDNADNSSIRGYGVIDGSGDILRNTHNRHIQLMDVTNSKNIVIENVVLRNSAEWTLHILGCRNVDISNLKIINDWDVHNTDGIDPDVSSNVYIRNYFGFCGDDAIAIKTTGNSDILKPAVNIEVIDSLVMTRKTSYKVGTETYADLRNIVFRNCEAINSARGAGLWMRDGGTMSNVQYINNTYDLYEIRGEGMSGEPVRIVMEQRDGIGKIENVIFENVISTAPFRNIIESKTQVPIQDVLFKNCTFTITPRDIKTEPRYLFELSNAQNIIFDNVTVNWQKANIEVWSGLIKKDDTDTVDISGIKEEK